MAVGPVSRSASCAGRPLHRVPGVQHASTGSFLALQTAMQEIKRLERAVARAPEADAAGSLLAHVLEFSDTACFSVSAAEAQYSSARAEYEASFSPMKRRLKRLGTRTRAYHAANVRPRKVSLIEARVVFERASVLKRKVEKSIESAEQAEQAACPSDICHPSGTFTELYSMISGHHDFSSGTRSDSL